MHDPGLSKAAGVGPVTDFFFDRLARVPNQCHIGCARPSDFNFSFVEDVEIVAESRRIGRGVQDDSTCKMTGLATIGRDELQHVDLERT
jgi:hypothetical protein